MILYLVGLTICIAYLSIWNARLGLENVRLAERIRILEIQREEDREKFELLRKCIH